MWCGAASLSRPVHDFLEIAISPDGGYVASVEGDETPSGEVDIQSLVVRATSDGAVIAVELPCGKGGAMHAIRAGVGAGQQDIGVRVAKPRKPCPCDLRSGPGWRGGA